MYREVSHPHRVCVRIDQGDRYLSARIFDDRAVFSCENSYNFLRSFHMSEVELALFSCRLQSHICRDIRFARREDAPMGERRRSRSKSRGDSLRLLRDAFPFPKVISKSGREWIRKISWEDDAEMRRAIFYAALVSHSESIEAAHSLRGDGKTVKFSPNSISSGWR